jgi:hypothetical protein
MARVITVRRLGSLWTGSSAWSQLDHLTRTGIVLVARIPRPSQDRREAPWETLRDTDPTYRRFVWMRPPRGRPVRKPRLDRGQLKFRERLTLLEEDPTMTTQNQSEKDPKPSTSSHDDAEVKTPLEIERQLTDPELATISGGANQTTSWRGAEQIHAQKVR